MRKSIICVAGLMAVIGLIFGPTASARMPFDAAADYPPTVDRSPVSLTAATVLPYGWPLNLAPMNTGVVDASFDDCGNFGSAYFPSGIQNVGVRPPSFNTPAGSVVQYLFGGTVWIGGIVNGDTLVSVGADGWYSVREFYPTGPLPYHANIQPYPYAADMALRGQFADTSVTYPPSDPFDGPHRPLNIEVANRSMVWRQSGLENAIVYDMVITNIGDHTIEQGYVGYMFDGDVCSDCSSSGFSDDLAGSIRERGIAYIIDNDGDLVPQVPGRLPTPRAFAFKFLYTSFAASDTAFNWWIPSGATEMDFGPRLRGTAEDPFRDFGTGGLGTPVGDRNKYYMLSHREWDYDQCFTATVGYDDSIWLGPSAYITFDLTDGFDTRFLMSIGPFDLAPDSSVRIIFTTFTADSIHVDPNNLSHLPGDPVAYEANLQLGRLPAVTDIVDTLTPYLTDPDLPPLGLTIIDESYGSAEIEWDPWAEGTVDGYDVYVTPVDPSTFPYPGAIPPWYVPSSPQEVASVGRLPKTSVSYAGGLLQAINVAHRFGAQTGQLSRAEWVNIPTPSTPPMSSYTYYHSGEPVVVRWTDVGADHYNIYKYSLANYPPPELPPIFKPFYSTSTLTLPDVDMHGSVDIDGSTYYYYAMTPYAQVPGGTSEFSEYIADSALYIVKAVDENGFESDYAGTWAFEVPAVTRNTLVLTNSSAQSPDFVNVTKIKEFYASVLDGEDYEIYDIKDSIAMTPYFTGLTDCPDWLHMMSFETIIIDDRYLDNVPYNADRQKMTFDRYQASGGQLLYFGSFRSGTGTNAATTAPNWYRVTNSWMRDVFGVDSAYNVGYGYFIINNLPMVDTVFGFNRAEPIGTGFPEMNCDTLAYPIGAHWATYWPTNTPPMIASFHADPESDVVPLYLYRSLVPERSEQEGTLIGLKNTFDSWAGPIETFAFGFHLYYMDTLDARALLAAVRQPNTAPTLSFPTDFDYRVKGVSPQRGYQGDSYEFRIVFSDPDGDMPYPGYPRVRLFDSLGQDVAGSPFLMTELKSAQADPFNRAYSVILNDLSPNYYSYRFEGRDQYAAAAATSPTLPGPIVTGPGGNVWHVESTGSDYSGDGSIGNPYASIGRAVRSSANGDTVLVGDGAFIGFLARGQAVVVKSANGPAATVIESEDPQQASSPAATFAAFEDSTTILDGFTVRYFLSTDVGGGALQLAEASPTIRNCRFENNVALDGGAVSCAGGAPLFDNCAFLYNRAENTGGAILCDQGAAPIIRNGTFVRNIAPEGGAAIRAADSASVTIEHCIIAYNYGYDAISCDQTAVSIASGCTDIFGNAGENWEGCLAAYEGVDGNFSLDPEFCDPAAGGFDLVAASPCAPANNSCGVMIGAFPVDPLCAGCCHLRGDVDHSGSVNIGDLTLLVSALFRNGAYPLCFEEADLDNSGDMNVADVTYLVAWLFQSGPPPTSCP